MRCNKRITGIMIMLVTIFLLLPVKTLAVGSVDLNQDEKLTISYQDNNKPLKDAEFSIYLVASMNEYGELAVTKDFSQFNVNIYGRDDESWKTLASTLEGYVLKDKISPADTGKTNEQGILSLPSQGKKLTAGLYLVLGSRHTQDGYIYNPQPFMVTLPTADKAANQWNYNLIVEPKHDSEPQPSEPEDKTITRKVLKVWNDKGYENKRPEQIEVQLLKDGEVYDTVVLNKENNWRYTWSSLDRNYKWNVVEKNTNKDYSVEINQEGITFVVKNTYGKDTPDNPKPNNPTNPTNPSSPSNPSTSKPNLPKTGQLWWPVPALLCAGLLFVVIGVIRRRGLDNE